MQNRSRAGQHGYDLFFGRERSVGYRHRIFAQRDGIEMKLSVRVGLRCNCKVGRFCLQDDLNTGNRAMLRIVDDAAHGAEDGCQGGACEQQHK